VNRFTLQAKAGAIQLKVRKYRSAIAKMASKLRTYPAGYFAAVAIVEAFNNPTARLIDQLARLSGIDRLVEASRCVAGQDRRAKVES
jgi:hypothetical protein